MVASEVTMVIKLLYSLIPNLLQALKWRVGRAIFLNSSFLSAHRKKRHCIHLCRYLAKTANRLEKSFPVKLVQVLKPYFVLNCALRKCLLVPTTGNQLMPPSEVKSLRQMRELKKIKVCWTCSVCSVCRH